MTKLGITLPMLNNSLTKTAELARAAEDAGFDSAFGYEFYRTPYVGMSLAAVQTSRISLGTGLAVALTRTPFLTANAAADIDELSNGRTLLGIGPGSPEFLAYFHDLTPDKPVSRMRDYVGAVRASWKYLATGTPGRYEGPHYRIEFPEFMPFGTRPMVRDRIPIYLSGMGPRMIQLAGEVADGLIGAFFSPEFLRESVIPNLTIGAARTGRELGKIDILSETVCAVHPDRSEAMRRARIQVGMYAAHPVADRMVAHHGLQRDQQELREALLAKGPDALEHTTSQALIDALSISGTPDECRKRFADYIEVMPHLLFHTPYVPPLAAEESEDAFRQILAAFS